MIRGRREARVPFVDIYCSDLAILLERQRRQHAIDFANEESERAGRFAAEAFAANQATLAAQAADRAKSTFLANMSHELRTPLNAIIGFSEVIHRDDLVPKDRYPEYAKHIYDAGIHLLTIVDQILDLARIEAGKLAFDEKLVSIMDIIRPCIDTVRRLAKDKSVTITSRSSIARRLILLDPVRMKQVLINLLANAVKFTGEGGRIAVTATIGTSGELVISVADTGIGIRSGDLERVLRPFEQAGDPFCRQKQGSGLGLPIARALVKLHGGDLVLESEFGRGTIASIHLPGDRIKSMESIPSEITQ